MLWNVEVSLTKAVDFVSRKCFVFMGSTEDDRDVTLDRNALENVTKFLYRGDVLIFGGKFQEVVSTRMKSG